MPIPSEPGAVSLRDFVLLVVLAFFGYPLLKWMASELWSRINTKQEKQDGTMKEVVTEVRAGFDSLKALIGKQDVTIAEVRVQTDTNSEEIALLRRGQHDLRDNQNVLMGKVDVLLKGHVNQPKE